MLRPKAEVASSKIFKAYSGRYTTSIHGRPTLRCRGHIDAMLGETHIEWGAIDVGICCRPFLVLVSTTIRFHLRWNDSNGRVRLIVEPPLPPYPVRDVLHLASAISKIAMFTAAWKTGRGRCCTQEKGSSLRRCLRLCG